MKTVCQLYVPAFYRSYGKNAIREIVRLLGALKKVGFWGIYLIAMFRDGGYDNGFDIVDYTVNPKFGADEDFARLISAAHEYGLSVGVDVVPNHVSDRHILARNCLEGIPGYEDCLYIVDRIEAERLTKAGVPNFFGKLAYSDFGEKYVRSTFADYHQLNLNWQSHKVQEYFGEVFKSLRKNGVDFARIDCGMMLLEDTSKADPSNPLACMNPKASTEAIRKVSGGMPLFFEWFDPASVELFENLPECYALDCSYIMSGKLTTSWNHEKLVPLMGGHDQMTLADRGFDLESALQHMPKAEFCFLDIQTIVGWKTEPEVLPGDNEYDADPGNPNQRYRGRRPIEPVIQKFAHFIHEKGS